MFSQPSYAIAYTVNNGQYVRNKEYEKPFEKIANKRCQDQLNGKLVKKY